MHRRSCSRGWTKSLSVSSPRRGRSLCVVGVGWQPVQSQVFTSETSKVQTDAWDKGSALCFKLSGKCFYPFNPMPGCVRDQLSGKTAHQRPVELGTTLSISDLTNRRIQERPKGTFTYSQDLVHRNVSPLCGSSGKALVAANLPACTFSPGMC